MSGWIGVDLDATLAQYHGWTEAHDIGEPVPAMLERVKAWLDSGREVRIFTARVFIDPDGKIALCIQDWLESHGLPRLQVTCLKDYGMIELWDDRAVQVEPNTGRRIGCENPAHKMIESPKMALFVCPDCGASNIGDDELAERYSDVLRELSSYVGCGGYNSEGLIDPYVALQKIRWGIDHITDVETTRLTFMKKYFVRFFSPGTLFAEQSEQEIDAWDVEKAQRIAEGITERHSAIPYGFQFVTRMRGPDDLDSHIAERSPMYFINCKVETLAEIEARNDPDEAILLSNMRINGYDRVAVTTKGWKWTQAIGPDDVVL